MVSVPLDWGGGIRGRLSVKILKFKSWDMTFPAILKGSRFSRFCHFIQIFNKDYSRL